MQAKQRFLEQIDAGISALNGSGSQELHQLRHHARAQFASAEFPDRKNEDWKYTSVRNLLAEPYTSADALSKAPGSDIDSAVEVLVGNGIIAKITGEVPGDGSFVGPLSKAWGKPRLAEVLRRAYASIINREMGVFESLGLAMSPDPLLVYIPSGVVFDGLIHVRHLMTASDATLSAHPYTLVVAEKNASVDMLESFSSGADGIYFMNSGNSVLVGANASVRQHRLQQDSPGAYHTATTVVHQQRDSRYGVYMAELGARWVRHNIDIVHQGLHVHSDIYGLFTASANRHIDTQSFIDHALPYGTSNELYKGILLDKGRGVFNGKIIVRPDAQKTNAFQQNAALVLSEDARMDSKPQLEIFADDVKCSHGATIGQLDKDAMFYLKSRGLNEAAAMALLKRAFLKDVIDHFDNERMAEIFLKELEQHLWDLANMS